MDLGINHIYCVPEKMHRVGQNENTIKNSWVEIISVQPLEQYEIEM